MTDGLSLNKEVLFFVEKPKTPRPVSLPTGPGDPLEIASEPSEHLEELEFGFEALEMEPSFTRDSINALVRASYLSDHEDVREIALTSLVEVVDNDKAPLKNSLIILQTWLDLFSRADCGNSISEYASKNRTRLLCLLQAVIEKIKEPESSSSLKAALTRVVSLAAEEMTRHFDMISDVQRPCSIVLVCMCRVNSEKRSQIDKVMETLLTKFQPGIPSHFYVLRTFSDIASANPIGIVPYLNGILGTMLANIKNVKADNLRYAYANAFCRFSDAVQDYLVNIDAAPDKSITESHFSREFDTAHDFLFTNWLIKGTSNNSQEFNVKNAVIEALGVMSPLLSDERVYKDTTQVVTTMITYYKKGGAIDPYFITQCIASLLTEMNSRDAQIIDPILESVLTALFYQVSLYSIVSTTSTLDEKRRNHFEVLRCYDVLVKSHHKEKLLTGLLLRLNSNDENIRLASLTVFKHLITSSLDQLQPRMREIFEALHGKLFETNNNNRIKSMLAQLTALLGRLNLLEGDKGRDFLNFIVRICALPKTDDEESSVVSTAANLISSFLVEQESVIVTNDALREMCDNILRLLASNVPSMESVLWPHLLEYLVSPDFSGAVPSIVKCLSSLITKKKESVGNDFVVDYSELPSVSGPQVIFARLVVLASVPFIESRGCHILTFMQHFAANLNKHLAPLWDQRIPLLLHYLETHSTLNEGVASVFDQTQWEDWLLGLLKDTLEEVDLDEWTSSVASTLSSQLSFYPLITNEECTTLEKLFLMKCLGTVLRSVRQGHNGQLVQNNLSSLFLASNFRDERQSLACADAYGVCAARHLIIVMEKLENLILSTDQRRRRGGSLFGLLRDGSKMEDEVRLATRTTILACVGKAAENADPKDLRAKCNEMIQKFVMPALQSSEMNLKLAALKTAADIAKALKKLKPDQSFTLVHHGDLIHEAIECMKSNKWMVKEKYVALGTALELVRLPPFISQLTRCSLLKACFTAVFPSIIKTADAADNKLILDTLLKIVQELLKQELKQCTVDEIFTLLEPYLKLPEETAREMAVAILQTALKTFLHNFKFQTGTDNEVTESGFSFAPYIIGGIIPRCFDTSKKVQLAALDSLQLILRISTRADIMFNKIIPLEAEDLLRGLQALSSSSPLLSDSRGSESETDSIKLFDKTVSRSLQVLVSVQHLQPLVTSLIENLEDVVGAKGTALVLQSILKSRGHEEALIVQTQTFLNLLYEKILVVDSQELKGHFLDLIKTLTVHNHVVVVSSLLNDHRLPYDQAITKVWKTIGQDVELSTKVLRHLLIILNPLSEGSPLDESEVYAEDRDRINDKTRRVAKRPYISAILALGILFEQQETEDVVKGEFVEVYVPLLFALCTYIGVSGCEPKVRRKMEFVTAPDLVNPYLSSAKTMKSFLNYFRIRFPQMNDFSSDQYDAKASLQFYEITASITYNVIDECPNMIPKIGVMMCDLLRLKKENGNSALLDYQRIAIISFFSQITLLTENVLSLDLVDTAFEVLLANYHDPEPVLKTLSLKGLSGYRLDTIGHINFLQKHSIPVLRAFLRTIGENFNDDVCFSSLDGLSKVIPQLPEETILNNLAEIVMKIFPSVDNSRQERDGTAAINCLGNLAEFVRKAQTVNSKETFFENFNSNLLVSLLLHTNDSSETIRKATKLATLKIFQNFDEDKNISPLLDYYESDSFEFYELLRHVVQCQVQKLKDDFPEHISKALTYFKNIDHRMRANAVVYVSCLVLDGQIQSDDFDPKSVCSLMAKLLTDQTEEVQKVAAQNLGKVLVRLKDNSNDHGLVNGEQ